MTFADPDRTVPEAARVLRRGGLLAFCTDNPLLYLCWPDGQKHVADRLQLDYFTLRRFGENLVELSLPYGAWIRLLRKPRLHHRGPHRATPAYRGHFQLPLRVRTGLGRADGRPNHLEGAPLSSRLSPKRAVLFHRDLLLVDAAHVGRLRAVMQACAQLRQFFLRTGGVDFDAAIIQVADVPGQSQA